MSVAREDGGNIARRRPVCKPPEPMTGVPRTSPAPSATGSSGTLRLDDLYRLPMPKLFALAEREGIGEHAGMNRGQLIVGIVRRQIERGEIVRAQARWKSCPTATASCAVPRTIIWPRRKTSTSRPARSAGWACAPGLVVEGPIRLPIEGQENFALMQVESVNGHAPEEKNRRNRVRRPDSAAPLETSGSRNRWRGVVQRGSSIW